jgi:hypothetical protein
VLAAMIRKWAQQSSGTRPLAIDRVAGAPTCLMRGGSSGLHGGPSLPDAFERVPRPGQRKAQSAPQHVSVNPDFEAIFLRDPLDHAGE